MTDTSATGSTGDHLLGLGQRRATETMRLDHVLNLRPPAATPEPSGVRHVLPRVAAR